MLPSLLKLIFGARKIARWLCSTLVILRSNNSIHY